MKRFVLVSCMGDVYRMSRRDYAKYLEQVVNGNRDADVNDYGVYIGTPVNVTDITEDWAKQLQKMPA